MDVHHVNGRVDPAEDAETINFELALADVAQIEKRLERLKKGRAKTKEEQASGEVQQTVSLGSKQCHVCLLCLICRTCVCGVLSKFHFQSLLRCDDLQRDVYLSRIA